MDSLMRSKIRCTLRTDSRLLIREDPALQVQKAQQVDQAQLRQKLARQQPPHPIMWTRLLLLLSLVKQLSARPIWMAPLSSLL